MKKIIFLIEMNRKGQLKLVEPSKEMQQAYIEKSDSNLESSKILLKSGKLEESTALSYFAMYNSILSLFYLCGIKSENHSASIILLNELFNEPELFNELSNAKKERINKQYYIDFQINKEETREIIKKAEDFVNKAKLKIRTISNQKIKNLREDLLKILR